MGQGEGEGHRHQWRCVTPPQKFLIHDPHIVLSTLHDATSTTFADALFIHSLFVSQPFGHESSRLRCDLSLWAASWCYSHSQQLPMLVHHGCAVTALWNASWRHIRLGTKCDGCAGSMVANETRAWRISARTLLSLYLVLSPIKDVGFAKPLRVDKCLRRGATLHNLANLVPH